MTSASEPGATVKGGAGPAAGAAEQRKHGRRKLLTGIVTSDKMTKTRTVLVSRHEKHPKYGKFVRRMTKFKVHDEKEVSHEGDVVRIAETRPLSKTKRWRLVGVVKQSSLARAPLKDLKDEVVAVARPRSEAPPAAEKGAES